MHTMFLKMVAIGFCLKKLKELVPKLDDVTKRQAVESIVAVGRKPTDFDAIMDREYVMTKQEYGLMGNYMIWVTSGRPNDALDHYHESDANVVALSFNYSENWFE